MRLSKKSFLVFPALASLLAACSGPAQTASLGPEVIVTSTGRAACEAIEIACDPHEQSGGVAKQCHDLGHSPNATEAMCIAHREECAAACPPR